MAKSKKKILSAKEFNYFKEWHNHYLKLFNQLQWNCAYVLEEVQGCHAKTFYTFAHKTATIYLSPEWKGATVFSLDRLRKTAKHEVEHLVTAKLYSLATSRYASKDEIDEAEEELVRLLDKILPL